MIRILIRNLLFLFICTSLFAQDSASANLNSEIDIINNFLNKRFTYPKDSDLGDIYIKNSDFQKEDQEIFNLQERFFRIFKSGEFDYKNTDMSKFIAKNWIKELKNYLNENLKTLNSIKYIKIINYKREGDRAYLLLKIIKEEGFSKAELYFQKEKSWLIEDIRLN